MRAIILVALFLFPADHTWAKIPVSEIFFTISDKQFRVIDKKPVKLNFHSDSSIKLTIKSEGGENLFIKVITDKGVRLAPNHRSKTFSREIKDNKAIFSFSISKPGTHTFSLISKPGKHSFTIRIAEDETLNNPFLTGSARIHVKDTLENRTIGKNFSDNVDLATSSFTDWDNKNSSEHLKDLKEFLSWHSPEIAKLELFYKSSISNHLFTSHRYGVKFNGFELKNSSVTLLEDRKTRNISLINSALLDLENPERYATPDIDKNELVEKLVSKKLITEEDADTDNFKSKKVILHDQRAYVELFPEKKGHVSYYYDLAKKRFTYKVDQRLFRDPGAYVYKRSAYIGENLSTVKLRGLSGNKKRLRNKDFIVSNYLPDELGNSEDVKFPDAKPDSKGDFYYHTTHNSFDEAQVYWMARKTYDYFLKLGFHPRKRPLNIYLNDRYKIYNAWMDYFHNSIHYSDYKRQSFTKGKMSRDNGTFAHEFTHYVMANAIDSMPWTYEGLAIHEGSSDLFRYVLTDFTTPGKGYLDKTHYLRNLTWKDRIFGMGHEVHVSGIPWGSALYELIHTINKTEKNLTRAKHIVATILFHSFYIYSAHTTYREALQALLFMSDHLYGNTYQALIKKIFLKRGLSDKTGLASKILIQYKKKTFPIYEEYQDDFSCKKNQHVKLTFLFKARNPAIRSRVYPLRMKSQFRIRSVKGTHFKAAHLKTLPNMGFFEGGSVLTIPKPGTYTMEFDVGAIHELTFTRPHSKDHKRILLKKEFRYDCPKVTKISHKILNNNKNTYDIEFSITNLTKKNIFGKLYVNRLKPVTIAIPSKETIQKMVTHVPKTNKKYENILYYNLSPEKVRSTQVHAFVPNENIVFSLKNSHIQYADSRKFKMTARFNLGKKSGSDIRQLYIYGYRKSRMRKAYPAKKLLSSVPLHSHETRFITITKHIPFNELDLGKSFFFCSSMPPHAFRKNPERVLKRIEVPFNIKKYMEESIVNGLQRIR